MITNTTKVLLVDDFDLVRMMLRRMLGEIGIAHIDDARDGEEALVKIMSAIESGNPYGAIFLDWNMPYAYAIVLWFNCSWRNQMGILSPVGNATSGSFECLDRHFSP